MAISASSVTGLVLPAAVLAAIVRVALRQRRGGLVRWRVLAWMALQPLLGAFLWLALFPPMHAVPAGELVVLAGDPVHGPLPTAPMVALPEYTGPRGNGAIHRVPDLGTALREHPAVARLVVVGNGLAARDRDAAAGLPLRLVAGAPSISLRSLDVPAQVARGNRFVINGRAVAPEGARVRLLDPAGQPVATAAVDTTGRFALGGRARVPGVAPFALELRDRQGALLEALPVPVRVVDPQPLRLIALAGSPSPELKYLRRWAVDTGNTLELRIATGGGLSIGGPLRTDAQHLAATDAVLLDNRSLAALPASQFDAVMAAARGGLGVLVRLEGTPAGVARERLRRLGLHFQPRSPALPMRAAPAGSPESSLPLDAASAAMVAITVPAVARPIGWWTAIGRGRAGATIVQDTYTAVLRGSPEAQADAWSAAFGDVARRARSGDASTLEWAWVGERSNWCQLPAEASVTGPDDVVSPLSPDPRHPGCAAYWPGQPGWHRLDAGDGSRWLYAWDATQGRGLRAQRDRDATLALRAAAASSPPGRTQAARQPGPSWPWALAWLLVAGLAWWLERRIAKPDQASA